jgi:hypothetical protein
MHQILPVPVGVRLAAIDTEDLADLLAQLAAVAVLELVARALVPAVGVWAA